MRVRDKNIKRAHVTVADRTNPKAKSKSVTVYGMTPTEVINHLKAMSAAAVAAQTPAA